MEQTTVDCRYYEYTNKMQGLILTVIAVFGNKDNSYFYKLIIRPFGTRKR